MQNFNVEVEVNGQWVHAHVNTLAEAQALLEAFATSSATIFDADIYINKGATAEAQAEFNVYYKAKMAKLIAKLQQVANA